MHRRSILCARLLTFTLLTACGAAGGGGDALGTGGAGGTALGVDAGPRLDGGGTGGTGPAADGAVGPGPDAASPAPDTSVPPADARTPPADGPVAVPDGAVGPSPDAASPLSDAGGGPPDIAPPNPDATVPPDCHDLDGDGAFSNCAPLDCDDLNAAVRPGALEICDGLDNNCDGQTDEGIDLSSNPMNCGACGRVCGPTETCTDGFCVPGPCPPNHFDLNQDPIDGCEYACVPSPDGIERCNERDDNCDGQVDEGIDLLSDPANCGLCGQICELSNATATCDNGVCAVQSCAFAWNNADGQNDNGCEYSCLSTRDGQEACDGIDNDCDGQIDEDTNVQVDVLNCGRCGHACGAPAGALESCRGGLCVMIGCAPGHYDLNQNPDDGCEYDCVPRAGGETCNGVDDDCDGLVDEGFDLSTDVANCGVCGNTCVGEHAAMICDAAQGGCAVGACDATYWDADGEPGNGCEYQCIPSRGGVEFCDLIDNDCDGQIDEDFPGKGDACGSDVGACVPGGLACINAEIVCDNAVGPTDEVCDGLDNNCDGQTDETFPGMGDACGSDVGACQIGHNACPAGALVCSGEITPVLEICDGVDNDCDGQVDEDEPDRGFSCPRDQWVFGNYNGAPTVFNHATHYDGTVNCAQTCAVLGLRGVGARFVCNLAGSGPTEGCDAAIDGQYGRANCGLMYDNGARVTPNGNSEDCAGGGLVNCINGSCSEGVTYHAIECQCGR